MRIRLASVAIMAGFLLTGCGGGSRVNERANATGHNLVGAWKSTIEFQSGAFASLHDLEFMYVFNAGGTMTESSNYDGAPPVPPAYGIWRSTGPNRFEAKYDFYATKPPAAFGELKEGGGWLPAGHGVFIETIQISVDGKAFTSTLTYQAFGPSGKPIEGGGSATGQGVRLIF